MKEFNSVEEVIEAVRGGKIVVVMDDEDRENEGDVICAAEFATPENVNFMASYAKGLITIFHSTKSFRKKVAFLVSF